MPFDRPTAQKIQRTKVAEFKTKTASDETTKHTTASSIVQLVSSIVVRKRNAKFRMINEFTARTRPLLLFVCLHEGNCIKLLGRIDLVECLCNLLISYVSEYQPLGVRKALHTAEILEKINIILEKISLSIDNTHERRKYIQS